MEKAERYAHRACIDVYSTVKKQGMPIEILKTKDEKPDYYTLVLIE